MDIIAPLLAADPASPRLTTYTESGRMELSVQTLGNWINKVANLLVENGIGAGSRVAIDCEPGWMPLTVVLGCWRVGAEVCTAVDAATLFDGDAAPPALLFTDDAERAEAFLDAAEQAANTGGGTATGAMSSAVSGAEAYLLSRDPFGRGVEESGGQVPFGIGDFSPEVRVQPDAFFGPDLPVDLTHVVTARASAAQAGSLTAKAGARVVCPGWRTPLEMQQVLAPLLSGGSVVMTTDTTQDAMAQLVRTERADYFVSRA